MKTFKLISLNVLKETKETVSKNPIQLKDGLIIDREDDKNQWLVEAYVERSYEDYFRDLMNDNNIIILLAKITKESNQPATFMASISEITQIEDDITVIFFATLVDRKKGQFTKVLKSLIDEGFEGDELLDEFKDRA
ncbi:YwpF family protein [Radiobacillus sp. PE A8.2]|uniref:YwpF family protein n=1 Tax=Radiobacillus sp. PE A8.2 TaxID=3380349 RepID=UPI003890FA64